jgi:hypothetical protein
MLFNFFLSKPNNRRRKFDASFKRHTGCHLSVVSMYRQPYLSFPLAFKNCNVKIYRCITTYAKKTSVYLTSNRINAH